MTTRRQFVLHTVGMAVASSAAASARAQAAFPLKPITIVIPTPPGGAVDLMARTAGKRVSDALGQPVIVDSRPGAVTMVATEFVARAQPDGHTLLLTWPSLVMNPLLYSDGRVRYDAKDLQAVTQIAVSKNVVFACRPGIRNLAEFIELGKRAAKPLTYSTSGHGNPTHFYGEIFARRAGIPLTMVPYKGEAPAIPDLAAGRLDAGFMTVSTADQHRASIKALAMTGKTRSALFPDVPTFGEQGVTGLDDESWYGLFAPKGTPPEVLERLSSEFARAVQAEKDRWQTIGVEPAGGSPKQFDAIVRTSTREWAQMIKETGIRLD
ncbi:tripartite tricarboxylate transporter substrate-binding protein [Variovorax sp. WS11]|uniref:Bug family tripartite tricarboxylate transporter substrate binding protein n=2 Tax=Variovorax sp. WS11 TaxID=1105204 RepID=UPI0013D8F23E|nr:tripartite tricarboxylate transporter substrate-binding protein [Variovorax sp. WS11]NDZ18929.1 tripartite tricarboxylate transporter substrate binding protein [Variovorax sp. WS11]